MMNFYCIDGPLKDTYLENQDFRPHSVILEQTSEFLSDTKITFTIPEYVTYYKHTLACIIHDNDLSLKYIIDFASIKYKVTTHECNYALKHIKPVKYSCSTPDFLTDFERWFKQIAILYDAPTHRHLHDKYLKFTYVETGSLTEQIYV
jgi:hypothetical protein